MKNPLIWMLSKLPLDSISQTRFVYDVNLIIVCSWFGMGLSGLYSFYRTWNFAFLFGATLTLGFFLLSLYSLKAARENYVKAKEKREIGIEEMDVKEIAKKLREK